MEAEFPEQELAGEVIEQVPVERLVVSLRFFEQATRHRVRRLNLLATAGTELPAYAMVALEAGAVDDCGHVRPAPQAETAELRPAANRKASGIYLRPVEDVMLAVDLGVDLHFGGPETSTIYC